MQRKDRTIIASAICGILILVFAFIRIPDYMLNGGILAAMTHHFFHANALHLAANCYVILVLLRRSFNWPEIICSYVIGTIAFFISPVPSVGFSNILYAIMGLRTPSFNSSWWKKPNTIIFFIVTIGYLFVPKVSAVTHLASFSYGVLVVVIWRLICENNTDYGKAKGRQ